MSLDMVHIGSRLSQQKDDSNSLSSDTSVPYVISVDIVSKGLMIISYLWQDGRKAIRNDW